MILLPLLLAAGLPAAPRSPVPPRSPRAESLVITLPGPISIGGVTYDGGTLTLVPHAWPTPPGTIVDLLDVVAHQEVILVRPGDKIAVRGHGFGSNAGTVAIAGVTSTVTRWGGALDADGWETIAVTVGPTAAERVGPVTLGLADGTQLSSAWQVTAEPASPAPPPPPAGPKITGFLDDRLQPLTRASYPNGNVTEIVIAGSGFGTVPGTIRYGGVPWDTGLWTDTRIIAYPAAWALPPGFPVTGDAVLWAPSMAAITVTRPDGAFFTSGPIVPWQLSPSTPSPSDSSGRH